MLAAILRKLRLGRAAYKFISPLVPTKAAGMTAAEGAALLSGVRADPGQSCLKAPSDNAGAESRDFDVDIIIPVYNTEKYIKACLNSVLSQQTRYKYRVIVIDDGSTDSTPEILKTYAGDERVLIKRQENRGLSGARNTGLELTRARYVYFLDSEDMLTPGALEALMSCAEENGAELVEGGYENVDTEGKRIRVYPHKGGKLEPVRDCLGFGCGKLLKTELFQELCFPPQYLYEDSVMAHILLPRLELGGKAYGVECPVFLYRVNPKGIIFQSKSSAKCIDAVWIHMQLYRDRQTLGMANTQAYYEYMLRMLALTCRRTARQPEQVRRAVFAVFSDFINREFSGYKTEDGFYRHLERSARAGDYGRYRLFCALA